MKRRTVLGGIGMTLIGLGTAAGTGAFFSAEADRDVSVSVAEEDQAFLALSPADGVNADEFVATGSNNEVEFAFGDINDSGEGVAPGSSYRIGELVEVENQSTEEQAISSSNDTGGDTAVFLIDADGNNVNEEDLEIDVGQTETLGIGINADSDQDIEEVDIDLTIEAEEPESGVVGA